MNAGPLLFCHGIKEGGVTLRTRATGGGFKMEVEGEHAEQVSSYYIAT